MAVLLRLGIFNLTSVILVSNKKFRLFDDYNSRTESANYVDGHDSIEGVVYQPFVYQAAFELVKRTGACYIIDIGCGDGKKIIKIKDYVDDCRIIMIDHEFIIKNISIKYEFADYISADLDKEIPEISDEILNSSVVVCSDVIEHLHNPNVLLSFLSAIKTKVKGIVLSTPERNQERGLFDYGPPANPFHVMEWSLDEFTRLLNDYGFTNKILAGLTISNTLTKVKATLITISSKFIDYPIEFVNNINFINTTLYCREDFSLLYKQIQKRYIGDIDAIQENDWYLFKEYKEEISTPNLRVTLNDILASANHYGFNIIQKTRLAISDKTENVWYGNSYIVKKIDYIEIAAMKGSLLKKVLTNQEYNARLYPFNLIGQEKNNINTLCFVNRFKKIKYIELERWHECIIRKDFLLELLFGASFHAK